MKKKIIALCLVVCLLSVAVIGGTLAYFTDTDQDVNVFISGDVEIDQLEHTFDADGNFVALDAGSIDKALKLMPAIVLDADDEYNEYEKVYVGNYYSTLDTEENGVPADQRWINAWTYPNALDKYVSVFNTGNNDAYVRTLVAIPAEMDELVVMNVVTGVTFTEQKVTGVMIGGVEHVIYVYTYIRGDGILEPGKSTGPSLYQVLMRYDVDEIDIPAAYKNGFSILCFTQAVQADGFAEALAGQANIPHQALNAAFGAVTATNNPWVNP